MRRLGSLARHREAAGGLGWGRAFYPTVPQDFGFVVLGGGVGVVVRSLEGCGVDLEVWGWCEGIL